MKGGVPSWRGGRYDIVALKDQVNIGFFARINQR